MIELVAGKCDFCRSWVEQLWITFGFRPHRAGCVDEALAHIDIADALEAD